MNSADDELPLEEARTATAPSFEAIEAHNEEDIVCHADLKERLTKPTLATILLPSQWKIIVGILRLPRSKMRSRRKRSSSEDPPLQS